MISLSLSHISACYRLSFLYLDYKHDPRILAIVVRKGMVYLSRLTTREGFGTLEVLVATLSGQIYEFYLYSWSRFAATTAKTKAQAHARVVMYKLAE